MRILLTNDDGIYAEGIYAAYKELSRFAEVIVVAPDSEQSSVGHGITLFYPLFARKISPEKHFDGYAVSGKPADCVKFAVSVLFKGKKPDLVISGINFGGNDGCSVFYSGTVAAAREGALMGIDSIAVSLNCFEKPDFSISAKFTAKIARWVYKNGLPKGTFLNVNLPPGKPKGARFTRQGTEPIHEVFEKRKSPHDKHYYWMGAKMPVHLNNNKIDTYALKNKYITITPIQSDLTDEAFLEKANISMISDEQIFAAKILAIDDNILNLQILKKILVNAGFINITTTTDPTLALSFYKEVQPDLVLLDLNMPKMDGFAVMVQLAILNPDDYLPVLILSAEDESIRFKALSSGAKDFLHKPYDQLDVLLKSRNIIEVRLLYNQIKNHNATLEHQVNERMKEIKDTRLDVIQRLAVAAELRDAGTGKHIYRMSRYCHLLASTVGFTKELSELLLSTSPLHDIGKIAIPDSILLKPAALTPDEFEVIKTHTTMGAKMLSGSDSVFLNMAETIALTHHEKWDGTGYPNRLKGEEIPMVGRVCALADVFDALSSARPYKEAWPFDKTVAEIRKLKGTHFDPKLVDAFDSISEDIKAIHDQG